MSGYTLKFPECSVYECLETYEEIKSEPGRMILVIDNFMKKYGSGGIKIDEKIIPQMWDIMAKYYFGGYFVKSTEGSAYAPISSTVDFLAERYAQHPIEFLKSITFSQLKELIDGAVWNMREMSEEGRKKNQSERVKNMSVVEKKEKDDTLNKLRDFAKTYKPKK